MTDAGRFERGEQYATAHGVVTSRGVDPITGLDVLIYDFAGAPTMAPGPAVSEHLLKVLAAEATQTGSGPRGRLVAAFPSGATLLAPGESAIDDRFALRALQGLKDAHALGVAHGDLGPSRLLYSLGDVYIEGFGVPWRAGGADDRAAMRADVVALAKALLSLAGDNLSPEVSAALRSAEAANPPMTAERLHAIVKRLAGGAVKVPASGFVDLTLPTLQSPVAETPPAASPPVEARAEPAPPPREELPPARREEPRQPPRPAAAVAPHRAEDPEPITLHSDPGLAAAPFPSPKDSSPGFVKAPPPGAKYRHGNLDEGPRPAPIRLDRQEAVLGRPRRSWRGPALLLLILLVAGFAGYLAWLENGREPASSLVTGAENHFVTVSVSPAGMPPVDLYVVQSPPGSRYPEGARLAPVPNRVAFDAAGTWVVHGRFLTRETPPVTLQVPGDAAITLVFPEQ